MLLTEPVATAASWFCRGGGLFPGFVDAVRQALQKPSAIIATKSTTWLVTWYCNLKKKKKIRLAFVKMDFARFQAWRPQESSWGAKLGGVHSIYVGSLPSRSGWQRPACRRAANAGCSAFWDLMKDPLAGGCIRLAAFELGRPRRSESDEVNLQTRPPEGRSPWIGT